jgi:hypothetical protein
VEKTKNQEVTDALNQAKAQAKHEKEVAAKFRASHMNPLTGLVDMPDGSHQFPNGEAVDGVNNMVQTDSAFKKKVKEVRIDKMTADELKAAYETAKAVEEDKAAEAELFRKAGEAKQKKAELMSMKKQEKPALAQQEVQTHKKHHKNHHKKHQEDIETLSEVHKSFVNDHYDADKNVKLENGANPHDFSAYMPAHYNGKTAVEAANAGAPTVAAPAAPASAPAAGGPPAEIAGTPAGPPAEIAGTQAAVQKESVKPEAEKAQAETISLVQKKKHHKKGSKKAKAAISANATNSTTGNSTMSAVQESNKKTFVNDHYDADKSVKLENGANPHDFSSYMPSQHYNGKAAGAPDVATAPAAGGPPAEIAGTQAAA